MSTLYELTEEYAMLLEMAEDPDTDPQAFSDTLEGLEGEIEMKADGYARVIRQIESDVGGLKTEIDRLQKRKTAGENAIKRMKITLQQAMEITGKMKFKTDLFSFAVQKNPASVVVDAEDISDIPDKFLIPQEPKVDKAAMKDALKAGDVADLDGIAHLEQTTGLRIR